MSHRLLVTLALPLALSLWLAVGVAGAADRPPGLMGKVASTLAAAALLRGNPPQMADVATVLEAGVLEAVEATSGIPWDLATLKSELATLALAPESLAFRDALSRVMADPVMTSLYPVFTGEVPIGTPQVGRIGRALGLFALRAGPPTRAAVGRLLAAHALERAMDGKEPLWDVRELRQVLAMWALSPENQASRDDVAATVADPRVIGALAPVFEQR